MIVFKSFISRSRLIVIIYREIWGWISLRKLIDQQRGPRCRVWWKIRRHWFLGWSISKGMLILLNFNTHAIRVALFFKKTCILNIIYRHLDLIKDMIFILAIALNIIVMLSYTIINDNPMYEPRLLFLLET